MRRTLILLATIVASALIIASMALAATGGSGAAGGSDMTPAELLKTKYPATPADIAPARLAQELASVQGQLAAVGVVVDDPVVVSLQPVTLSWTMTFDSWERYLLDTAAIHRVLGRMRAAGTLSAERISLEVTAPNGVRETLYSAISPPMDPEKWTSEASVAAKQAANELVPRLGLGLAKHYGVTVDSLGADVEGDATVVRMKLTVPDGSETEGLSSFVEQVWDEIIGFNDPAGRVAVSFIAADDTSGRLVLREVHDYVMGRVVSYSDTGYLPAASRVEDTAK